MHRRLRWIILATFVALGASVLAIAAPPGADTADAACGTGTKLNASQLNAAFAGPGLGSLPGFQGFGGGDYQHSYQLPDGRVLWLFQDLYFSDDDNLNAPLNNAAHNAGLLQDGSCWAILGSQGRDLIGDVETIDSRRWFWPMDGEIGADGNLWIFMVEMSNAAGNGASTGALPVRTWLAVLDPNTLQQLSFQPAPDAGASKQLYGWSIVSNDQYSYMYGHCYRQFAHAVDGPGQFDNTCMPSTYLSRVPLGHFDVAPQYWTGAGWSDDANTAKPVLTRGAANPMSVQWFGDVWVSVTKADDWWGTVITVDRAPAPEGPWTTAQTFSVLADRKCSNQCGNYSALLLPYLDASGSMTIGLSNGGEYSLWLANGWLYRPTFYSVPVPAPLATSAAQPAVFPTPKGTAGFQAVDPRRLLDTRVPGQAFATMRAGTQYELDLRQAGMPAGSTAAALNLTAVNAPFNGYVRAWACSSDEPPTSNVNQVVGMTQTNAAIVPVGDGRLCFRSSTDVDLVVDLNGWLTPSSDVGLQPVASRRLVDTRSGIGGSTRLQPNQMIEVQVVPPGSPTTAVALNVTAVEPSTAGYVTVWPCGVAQPVVSNLNPEPHVTQPNFVDVRVGASGKVCIYTLNGTDLVVDLTSEYRPGATARYAALAPTRLLDSRVQDTVRHQSNLSYMVPLGSIAAAQVNLTATDASAAGYLTGYPCLTEQWPGTSNVNYTPANASANSALLTGSRGYACVFPSRPTNLVVDIFGVWN